MNFKIVTDPNITYILLFAGIYGIMFELYSPGVLFRCSRSDLSILSGYGLHLLPINYAGLFLVITGMALLTLELFITSYGFLAPVAWLPSSSALCSYSIPYTSCL